MLEAISGNIITLNNMNIGIIQDRIFDAECARRAGLIDLHDQILARLNGLYPELKDYIKQAMEVYGEVGDSLTEARSQYLKEHRSSLKLRYR